MIWRIAQARSLVGGHRRGPRYYIIIATMAIRLPGMTVTLARRPYQDTIGLMVMTELPSINIGTIEKGRASETLPVILTAETGSATGRETETGTGSGTGNGTENETEIETENVTDIVNLTTIVGSRTSVACPEAARPVQTMLEFARA